jgi:6-phospho-3-hexuloisomerase
VKGGLTPALAPVARVLARVRLRDVESFETTILSSRRVFLTGLGRTGLIARGFAMRLMHLGRRVYHVGDVITPAIRRGDLLVVCSRTGRSPILRHYMRIARKVGARVALVTADRHSPVASAADVVLELPSETKDPKTLKGRYPEPPLGSVFEQAMLLVLDQVVVRLMRVLCLSPGDLRRIHTTFE